MRGLLSLGVGGLGEALAHFPLYIVEAALVEGVALLVSAKRSPLVFGAWCGVAIGTVGLAAEWGWSHVWMPIPWPAEILPEVAALGLATALAGSLDRRLHRRAARRRRDPRRPAACAAVALPARSR